jgi:hypothetical protein
METFFSEEVVMECEWPIAGPSAVVHPHNLL